MLQLAFVARPFHLFSSLKRQSSLPVHRPTSTALKCIHNTSEKPRIVVLPGMDGTELLLDPFRQNLSSPSDSRVIGISYPPDESLSIPDLANFVHSKLPHDDPRGYILLAQSFSGHVAMHLAPKISPLAYVFVNAFASPPGPDWVRAAQYLPSQLFRYQPPARLVAPFFLGDGQGMQIVQDAGGSNLPEVMQDRLRLCLTSNSWHLWRNRQLLPGEKTLYLRGTSDFILSTPEAEALRRSRPDVRWVEIEQGPHLLLQRFGEQCAHAVESFSNDVATSHFS